MTIKDAAKYYNVSESSLRYYEQIGLLSPIKRVNGIRVYSDEDLIRIKRIVCLRNAGLTIEEIQAYLYLFRQDSKVEKDLLEILKKQKDKLTKQIVQIEEALEYLRIEIEKYK